MNFCHFLSKTRNVVPMVSFQYVLFLAVVILNTSLTLSLTVLCCTCTPVLRRPKMIVLESNPDILPEDVVRGKVVCAMVNLGSLNNPCVVILNRF